MRKIIFKSGVYFLTRSLKKNCTFPDAPATKVLHGIKLNEQI